MPTPPPGPFSVVFDVGSVLVEADYQPFLDFMRRHGAGVTDMDAFCAEVDLDGHERGELGPADFLDRLAARAPLAASREALLAHWNGMYRPDRPMLALYRAIAERQPVHLLSNMGELHVRHLTGAFGLAAPGPAALWSYTVGALKPDPRIYAAAEARFALDPARTVFVDDRAVNAAAARERGWSAIEHRSAAATETALRALGIEVGR